MTKTVRPGTGKNRRAAPRHAPPRRVAAEMWAAVLAGALYVSWPLGFVLNPLVARTSFASRLEAAHQPYNWLFVALDVASGVLLLAVGARQLRRAAGRSVRLSIVAYMLFGALVVLAALAPDNCPAGGPCGRLAATPDYIMHGFASIASVLFLLISFLMLGALLLARRMPRRLTLPVALVAAAWLLTGAGALAELPSGAFSNWLQYGLITICGATIALCAGAAGALAYASVPVETPALQRIPRQPPVS